MRNHNLEEWLTDPKAAEFLGRAAALKIEIMAAMVDGSDTLTAIGLVPLAVSSKITFSAS